MTMVAPARIINRLLASPAAQTVAADLEAEDLAQRRALVANVAEHRRAVEVEAPRMLAEAEKLGARIPEARQALRDAIAAHASVLARRQHLLQEHATDISEAETTLRLSSPPFLTAALRQAREDASRASVSDDGADATVIAREAAKWAIEQLSALQLAASPTVPDVDRIVRHAPAVGRLWLAMRKAQHVYRGIAATPTDTKGRSGALDVAAKALAALRSLDPSDPMLDREVTRIRDAANRKLPDRFRHEWK